jgi:hypothetical protein
MDSRCADRLLQLGHRPQGHSALTKPGLTSQGVDPREKALPRLCTLPRVSHELKQAIALSTQPRDCSDKRNHFRVSQPMVGRVDLIDRVIDVAKCGCASVSGGQGSPIAHYRLEAGTS